MKIFLFYTFIYFLSACTVFSPNKSVQILTNENIENFIENWGKLNNDFANHLKDTDVNIYLNAMRQFVGNIEHLIVMPGLDDDSLQQIILAAKEYYNGVMNLQVPDIIDEIFLKNNIQNGHKIYSTLIVGTILIRAENMILSENDNSNITRQSSEEMLRTTRALFQILNQNDFAIIKNYIDYFFNYYIR